MANKDVLKVDVQPSDRERNLESAKGRRAADFIVSQIEAQILSEKLKNGDPLPAERELMKQFGISRTVVREAIAILSSMGLLETKPRFRPIVHRPGFNTALHSLSGIVGHLLQQPDGVKNLFDTRIFLEAMLVREAALHANKEDIKKLKNALQANKEAIDDSQQFYATDVAFHSVLYAIPGNPVFTAVHKAYTNWLAEHWQKMPRMPKRNLSNYKAHRAIFEGIRNRDPDEAENALRSHLNKSWEDIKATLLSG